MLFLPIEINSVKIDALVDSGALINAFSERDAEKIKHNASKCIIEKAPSPPFKNQYANAELEQPLATYMMRFKIGDYSFQETFIIMNQTSFPIVGLAFLRKHAAILDTAQGIKDFPRSNLRWFSWTKCRNVILNRLPTKQKANRPFLHRLHVSYTR